jgi:hypothetical protein
MPVWTGGQAVCKKGNVVDSTAHYILSGLDITKAERIQAYIPANYTTAPNTHYHVCSPSGGCADSCINQDICSNVWVNIGAVCTTNGAATVVLSDDGGNPYGSQIGADAIRAVPTGITC